MSAWITVFRRADSDVTREKSIGRDLERCTGRRAIDGIMKKCMFTCVLATVFGSYMRYLIGMDRTDEETMLETERPYQRIRSTSRIFTC